MKVARFKAAKYTVEGPLLLGATLADAPDDLQRAYSDYGLPLGEAFQLRDDLLGVFGDPQTTGKPAGDDLREGKRTVLVAIAGERADARQQAVIRKHLGDPRLDEAGVDALREVIAETGAQAEVESLIEQLADQAIASLQHIPEPARSVLSEMIHAATTRTG
jgi:geranylgeranyl diphosphate synthase type I